MAFKTYYDPYSGRYPSTWKPKEFEPSETSTLAAMRNTVSGDPGGVARAWLDGDTEVRGAATDVAVNTGLGVASGYAKGGVLGAVTGGLSGAAGSAYAEADAQLKARIAEEKADYMAALQADASRLQQETAIGDKRTARQDELDPFLSRNYAHRRPADYNGWFDSFYGS